MRTSASAHYNSTYWEYQREIGQIGADLNRWKFAAHISPEDTVVDFGCGGGFLLAGIDCARRIGVEPGDAPRAAAIESGLEMFATASSLPTGVADVVISNHALEHALRPLDELRELHRALKPGGRAILVVPIDDWRSQHRYTPSELNHHLYTWTPLLLGHLLSEAGFVVLECRILRHAWRRKMRHLKGRVPSSLYNALAAGIAMLLRSRQILVVATRE